MKKYMIEVVPKFEINPTAEEFESICDKIIDAVDGMCNNNERSFHVTFPTQTDIDENRFYYRINVIIKSEEVLSSAKLFELLDHIHPLTLVNLQETRFCKKADTEIYWFHEGETTYHDGSTYISPNYDLYINGKSYYTIQYVPVAIKNMYERDKKRYEGVKYMWRCTTCWDNFMQATTIDEAIEEFEKYYQKYLLRSIEGSRKSLEEATDKFVQFEEYRWNKKW